MNRKLLWKLAFTSIALILVFLMVYSGLRIWESTVFLKELEQVTHGSKTLSIDGVDYYPRQDIFVVLLMGMEEKGANRGFILDGSYTATKYPSNFFSLISIIL